MTLCVVTRHKQQVQVATDSRLNWGISNADIGVKIMTVPLRLHPPKAEGNHARSQPEYSRTLGLAAVGSLPTTYVAKELLGSVLSSLQFVPGATDISMSGIAEVCARILRNVSREICRALFADGTGQLVLVGRCLITEQSHVFVLTVENNGEDLDVLVEEFTDEDAPLFLGSGAAAARRAASRHSIFAFDVVREVAANEEVKTVGGNVQFGVLEAKEPDFRVTGVRDYRVNHARKEVYLAFYMGGLEIMGGASLLGDINYAINTSYLNPVRREVDRLVERGYLIVPSTTNW